MRWLFGIAGFALALLAAGGSLAERRAALVIGNAAYRHAPVLANPENDARAVGDALRSLGFDVIEATNLDRRDTETTLKRFFIEHLSGADVGLFYYSGHGVQVAGENYMLPVDAELAGEAALAFEAVSLQRVLRLMESAAKINLLFVDACRDNPLARRLTAGLGATRSAVVGRGLAEMETPLGALVAHATAPGSVARDGQGRHSPFTKAFLEYVSRPGLEVRQFMTEVRRSVYEQTGGEQIPWDSSSLISTFYFNPGDAPVQPRPAAAPPQTESKSDPETERLYWKSIKDSNNMQDFRTYMFKFPDSAFFDLAQRKYSDLFRRAAREMMTTGGGSLRPCERYPSHSGSRPCF